MAENKTKPTKVRVAAFIDAMTDQSRRADAKALVKCSAGLAYFSYMRWTAVSPFQDGIERRT
jgi:hypothetical protein